eukprot:m.643728 g.643728  ORF g.643728 m.643728 type:complete len:1482 (+) comp22643_c0_seq28:255-4700(+)
MHKDGRSRGHLVRQDGFQDSQADDVEMTAAASPEAGSDAAKTRWEGAISAIRTQGNVLSVVQQLQESVATTAVNLSDSPKVIQTLQKELKKSGDPAIRAIKHDELGRGNSTNNDRFLSDDLVVVDYGRRWREFTDIGFKIGLRHNEHEQSNSKTKQSLLMYETDESMLEDSEASNIIYDRSSVHRVPYLRVKSKVFVWAATSPAQGSDDVHLSISASGNSTEKTPLGSPTPDADMNTNILTTRDAIPSATKIPLADFFSQLIKAMKRTKNRKTSRQGVQTAKLQHLFDARLESSRNPALDTAKRTELLQGLIKALAENEENFTDRNTGKLLGYLRELKLWDEMLQLIHGKEALANKHGTSLSPDAQYFRAVAMYERQGLHSEQDRAKSYDLICDVCDKYPNYMDAQGLKGRIYKKKFSHAFRAKNVDPDTMEEYREKAVQAYKMLYELEIADKNTVPSWSVGNLVVMLFAGSNTQESIFEVCKYVDKLNSMLSGRLDSKRIDVWGALTLFQMNVVAGYLFQNEGNFAHANAVVAILLTLSYKERQIETSLEDLSLIHEIHLQRKIKQQTSIEEQRFNFWYYFLKQIVSTPADLVKFPVLMSSTSIGSEDYGKMSKMYVTLERIGKSVSKERSGDPQTPKRGPSLQVRGRIHSGFDSDTSSQSGTAQWKSRGLSRNTSLTPDVDGDGAVGRIARGGSGGGRVSRGGSGNGRISRGGSGGGSVGDGGSPSPAQSPRPARAYLGAASGGSSAGNDFAIGSPLSEMSRSSSIGGDWEDLSSPAGSVDVYQPYHFIIQLTPAIPGEGGRQIECMLSFVDIRNADIPKSGDFNEVDDRRLILSASMLSHGRGASHTASAETFTLLFASRLQRSQFWDLCLRHGYADRAKQQIEEESCPEFEYLYNDTAEGSKRVVLGQGSFATVYKGRLLAPDFDNGSDGRIVAIKELRENLIRVPHVMADFLGEISKLRGMKHRNIVEFIGAWKEEGVAVTRIFLMEAVDGSLSTLLDLFGRLMFNDFPDFISASIGAYAFQMVSAVEYLHTYHSFCHRDIKPANFLVDRAKGTVKLTDFGTVKDMAGLEKLSNEVVGSMPFQDINVIKGNEYGLEIDVYGLGSAVWELATGNHPYKDAENEAELLAERNLNPQGSPMIPDEWPVDLKNFISACFRPKETRPTTTELQAFPLVAQGSKMTDDWEEDLLVQDLCESISLALRHNREHIIVGWKQRLAAEGEDRLNEIYHEEQIQLLDILTELLVEDSIPMAQVWQSLSNLVSSDVSARDQFNRARDFVTMLNAFEFPPPPTDAAASILARKKQHFLVPALRTSQLFVTHPHAVWEAANVVNDVVGRTINDILPAISRERKLEQQHGRSATGSNSMSRFSTRAEMDGENMPLQDTSNIMQRLEELQNEVAFLTSAMAPRPQSNVKPMTPAPVLYSYLQQCGVPDPKQYGKILQGHYITRDMLEAKAVTRAELVEIGLPLGIAARLVAA